MEIFSYHLLLFTFSFQGSQNTNSDRTNTTAQPAIESPKCKLFEPVSITIDKAPESSTRDLSSKSQGGESELDTVKSPYVLTRSQSVSSSSDLSRGLESSPAAKLRENESNLAAHSLTDVSNCTQPGCRNRHRNHRHSTPGAFGSYLRLCSVVDLPILGKYLVFELVRQKNFLFVLVVKMLITILLLLLLLSQLYILTYFVLFYNRTHSLSLGLN